MAGFVASPNTIQLKLRWLFNNTSQFNILHAEYTIVGPLNPNVADQVDTALRGSTAFTNFMTHMATDMQYAGVGILDMRSQGVPEILSTAGPVVGTATGSALPPQVSSVITLRTALTGRAHRGRVYLFGYSSAALTPTGGISATVNTDAVAFVSALGPALNTIPATLAIRSTAKPDRPAHDGSTLPAKPYEITPVTAVVARDAIWDTNRRRTDLLKR